MKLSPSKIKTLLKQNRLDALFITNQHNVSYLSGFSGLSPEEREGFILLTSKKMYLLTFSTYFGLFRQIDDIHCLCISPSQRLSYHLQSIAESENLSAIGFEKTNLTVSELESLQKKVTVDWIPVSNIIENLRIIKTPEEISKIKKAARITDEAFNFILKHIKKEETEKEIALQIEFFLKKKTGDIAFSPIVAFNTGSAIPHYIPSNSHKLIANSLILLDFGAQVDGYCADMTRVIFFGKPKPEFLNIYNTVKKAQEIALKSIKPGQKTQIPDIKAKEYIKSQGYPKYLHGLGHGVGLAIHEAPRLKTESDEIFKENMVVTVEPGIYIEGTCGVRIEDLILLKDKGIEILSKSTKDIIFI